MISFSIETQQPVYWTSVTWCFVFLAALCCCNGLPHQKTVEVTQPLRSASESSTMADTTERPQTSMANLGSLVDAGGRAVVTLVAGDTRLAAHRAVLAARSPVFAAMFRPGTLEASSREVTIPDVDGPVLRQLVAFLYSGRAPHLSVTALQLLAAAEKYGVSALNYSCEQVADQLSVKNAAATAVLAIRFRCHSLRQAAIKFIWDHFEVVTTDGWADAVLSYPDEVVQITRLLGMTPTETSTTAITYSIPITTAAFTGTTSATSIAEASMPTKPAAPVTAVATAAATSTTAGSTPGPTAATPASPTAMAQTSSDLGWTPSTASLPAAGQRTPPPDAADDSHLQNLSAEEKGQRLIQAAKEGAVQEVRALLTAGAAVGARDGWEWTALHWAAGKGHVEVVECLLQAGAEADARGSWQWTPLHKAADRGRTAVVRLLLAAAADPNATSVLGKTPLHWAAHWGQAEAAAALLQAGADKGTTSVSGETALHIARRRKHHQLIQMLQ